MRDTPSQIPMPHCTIKEKEHQCEAKLKQRLGLKEAPAVTVVKRRVIKVHNGLCQFEPIAGLIETVEGNEFENYHDGLACYGELHADRDTTEKCQSYTIECIVSFGEVKVSTGYVWVCSGALQNKQRFNAILSLYVNELYRGCSISSLLKLKEIELAGNECDFIQIFHESDNPYFNSAIIPSLSNGYVLHHGAKTGGELYENNGFIHLRFTKIQQKSSVTIKGLPKPLVSPDQNDLIIKELTKGKVKYPGRRILKIKTI